MVFRQIANRVVIWFTDSSLLSFSVVSWFSRSLITDTASVTGILVNRAVTSKDTIFLPGRTSNSSIFVTNCMLFFSKWSVFPTRGLEMLAKNFAVLYVILPILDTIGLNGTLFWWRQFVEFWDCF